REYAGSAVRSRCLPRARGLALGYALSPASTRAQQFEVVAYPGLADSPWATRCRPRVRGLSSSKSLPTQGSRTRPGLRAVAREYAGSAVRSRCLPRARGLALGHTLSPAGAGLLNFKKQSSIASFKQTRCSLAAADTHRHHAVL